jgi:hypothetical protein
MSQQDEINKQHVLYFAAEPAGQIERAYKLLNGLENLKVEMGSEPDSLRISYSLLDYSLERLENALILEGFCFRESMLHKLGKKLIYYCEDVQYHNLNTPEHLTKSNHPRIFTKIYDQHPHGDHDETPKELREYK